MIWKPTMALRFHIEDGLKILQQKWVAYAMYNVQDGPAAAPKAIELKTDKYEWRDVPLVEAKDELAD